MGQDHSCVLPKSELDSIRENTGFSSQQITRLYHRFCQLDKTTRHEDKAVPHVLNRRHFEHIPQLNINPLGVRIIDAFFSGNREMITFRDFMEILAIFRPLRQEGPDGPYNTRDRKLQFVFDMYDVDGDGVISKEELARVLQMMVGVHVTPEQLKYVLELTLEEADDDHDGEISFEDFKHVMARSIVEEKLSIRFLS